MAQLVQALAESISGTHVKVGGENSVASNIQTHTMCTHRHTHTNTVTTTTTTTNTKSGLKRRLWKCHTAPGTSQSYLALLHLRPTCPQALLTISGSGAPRPYG